MRCAVPLLLRNTAMAAKPKPDPSAGKLICKTSPLSPPPQILHLSKQPTNTSSFPFSLVAPAGTNPSYQASQYTQSTLHRTSLSPSPITQFHTWFTMPPNPLASTNPKPSAYPPAPSPQAVSPPATFTSKNSIPRAASSYIRIGARRGKRRMWAEIRMRVWRFGGGRWRGRLGLRGGWRG